VTEGKDSNRIVTRKSGDGVVEYSIKKGVTIIYTLALENEFKKDQESSRRLINFRTDSSKEHLEGIHDYKAKHRYTITQSADEIKSLESKLKEHIYDCIELRETKVIDPFSDYIISLVPKTQKSIGYIDHYYALLDGCVRFNFNQRTKIKVNDEWYLLANLEDHYNIHQIYFKDFMRTLKDLITDGEDASIFDNIPEPDWAACFKKGQSIVLDSPEMESFRKNSQDELIKWYERQVGDGKVDVLDYKTGQSQTLFYLTGITNESRESSNQNN
jgi:hypothetical protein